MSARDGSERGRVAAPATLLQSVQRATALLRILAREGRPMATRELSKELGTNRSTCYHLVNTLTHEGFLARDEDGRVRLGAAVGELYAAFAGQYAPDPRLLESLEELNVRTRETSYVGMWEGNDVVSAAVREGLEGVRVRAVTPGYREHAYARALGRALLAFRDDEFISNYLAHTTLERLTPGTTVDADRLHKILLEVRKLGHAIEREEFTIGVCCVAVPVFDKAGSAVAALGVSVPKARFEHEAEFMIETVRDAAAGATIRLHSNGGRVLV